MTTTSKDRNDRIGVVAGGSRGAGRGIAVELGTAGATVYVTGRTTAAERSPMGRPETIEDTARLVDEAGGSGIPVRIDHTEPEEVRTLIERIAEGHGRLDILVNDVWGGDPLTEWDTPFWQHDLTNKPAGATALQGSELRVLRDAALHRTCSRLPRGRRRQAAAQRHGHVDLGARQRIRVRRCRRYATGLGPACPRAGRVGMTGTLSPARRRAGPLTLTMQVSGSPGRSVTSTTRPPRPREQEERHDRWEGLSDVVGPCACCSRAIS
jgi:NAD(P)-dependent dehydrogenase (short-subunit alcohol dehydrogenase family)